MKKGWPTQVAILLSHVRKMLWDIVGVKIYSHMISEFLTHSSVHRNAGLVQCLGHCSDLLFRKLVTHGMRAIAQTAIGNAGSLHIAHATASFVLKTRRAVISPTRRAAAVMISRLPAYFGK